MQMMCPKCNEELVEAYVYSSETKYWERANWNGEILFRCYSDGYFTKKFLDEHPEGIKNEVEVEQDCDTDNTDGQSNAVKVNR